MNHNSRCHVVHPQCRGYIHKTAFYSTYYKIIVLICALSCRSLRSLKPRTQQQASAHTAADLPFPHKTPLCTQLGLNLLTKTLIQSLIFALQ